MRIGLPLLLFNCFAIAIYAKVTTAQEILDKRINLIAEQKEIKVILNEISRLAEIKFVYSSQKVPARKKVSIVVHDRRLGDVLDLLLGPLDVFYRVSGNQIVLVRKGDITNAYLQIQETSNTSIDEVFKTVTGKVTNENGEPLAGVSVIIRGTSRGTVTNSIGEFSINVEAGETLEFSMVGYRSQFDKSRSG